jgi:trehalose 6-phosphate synthase
MLGNDLLGFQTQQHCNNFLETVDRALECRIDREKFAVARGGHETSVRPFPISVDTDLAKRYLGNHWEMRAQSLRKKYRLADRALLVGVDRVDYTKGIPERLLAVNRLLQKHPELRGKFHFLQVGAPSRTHLTAYRDLTDEVQDLADRINWEHGTERWQPVVFLNEHRGPKEITLLYRMAAGCVVSSLHDGMNLVAKEFVAAREDEQGVLVLSKFTGAAQELTDAILINPFDVEQLSAGMHDALTMPVEEQERRMRRMRAQVEDHNIYRWAGQLLSAVGKMVPEPSTRPVGVGVPQEDEASEHPREGFVKAVGLSQ